MTDYLRRAAKKIFAKIYKLVDFVFIRIDKLYVLRSRNILTIPSCRFRKGGKRSLAEWGHTIGIFQTLIHIHKPTAGEGTVLDIGCGTGLLAISCNPIIEAGWSYIGLDVRLEDIEFCKQTYANKNYDFRHLEVNNPSYSPNSGVLQLPWPIEAEKIDLAVALSVWTHFSEKDARFYMQEISRVLKSGGKAIVTFFVLDETYRAGMIRPEFTRHFLELKS